MEKSKTGLLAAIIHELLKTESFETLADLSDAAKRRCAKLKIPYNTKLLTDAARLVARTRPVLKEAPKLVAIEPTPVPDDISPQQASAILEKLGVNIRGGRLRPKLAKRATGPDSFELMEVR